MAPFDVLPDSKKIDAFNFANANKVAFEVFLDYCSRSYDEFDCDNSEHVLEHAYTFSRSYLGSSDSMAAREKAFDTFKSSVEISEHLLDDSELTLAKVVSAMSLNEVCAKMDFESFINGTTSITNTVCMAGQLFSFDG